MKPSRMRRHQTGTPNAAVSLLDATVRLRDAGKRQMMRDCARDAVWWIRRCSKPRQTTFDF